MRPKTIVITVQVYLCSYGYDLNLPNPEQFPAS